jgi:hypothetical protein
MRLLLPCFHLAKFQMVFHKLHRTVNRTVNHTLCLMPARMWHLSTCLY